MAIGRSIEESLFKAIDCLDVKLNYNLGMKNIDDWTLNELDESLRNPDDERIFVLSKALERGYTVEKLHEITQIDEFFINKLKNIVDLSSRLRSYTIEDLPEWVLRKCKKRGLATAISRTVSVRMNRRSLICAALWAFIRPLRKSIPVRASSRPLRPTITPPTITKTRWSGPTGKRSLFSAPARSA